ncbi:MAG: helix-turn-helix transcriptional regulator [Clostridia bacterium]|nr:helix-turn-helix transcriptional regulator [Clostridia bacterium]
MKPKKLSVAVGSNLKRIIKKSEYKTQESFAEGFGIEVRTVNRWVNDGIRDIDAVEDIASFLKIDVFELLRY